MTSGDNNLPGLSRTLNFNYQDFPGPGSLKKKIQDFPGGTGTLSIALPTHKLQYSISKSFDNFLPLYVNVEQSDVQKLPNYKSRQHINEYYNNVLFSNSASNYFKC